MSDNNLKFLSLAQLREVLLDAARKLTVVKETVKNTPEIHIPFPRLQEIEFLEQRIKNIKLELAFQTSQSSPVKVFYSYSHHDEPLMSELYERLANLQEEGLIEVFWDKNIAPGNDWHAEITGELKNADIVLFLVSSDFLNSRYCQQVELPSVIEMHECGLVRAIPIILSDCDWKKTPLGRLQAIPSKGIPLTECPDHNEAWLEILQDIKKAIGEPKRIS